MSGSRIRCWPEASFVRVYPPRAPANSVPERKARGRGNLERPHRDHATHVDIPRFLGHLMAFAGVLMMGESRQALT